MDIDITSLTPAQRKRLLKSYSGKLIRATARRSGVDHSLVSRVWGRRATSQRAANALGATLAEFPDIRTVLARIGAASAIREDAA